MEALRDCALMHFSFYGLFLNIFCVFCQDLNFIHQVRKTELLSFPQSTSAFKSLVKRGRTLFMSDSIFTYLYI